MHTGHVIWFNDSKGFGLIETEGGQTVFVHYTSIAAPHLTPQQILASAPAGATSKDPHAPESTVAELVAFRSLKEGQKVEFDLYEDDEKGYLARNVIAC